jgi:hypothetical protein
MEMKVIDLNALLMELEKMLRRVMGEDVAYHRPRRTPGKNQMDPPDGTGRFEFATTPGMPCLGREVHSETTNVSDEEYARSHIVLKPGSTSLPSLTRPGCLFRSRNTFEPFYNQGKGRHRIGSQRLTDHRAAEHLGVQRSRARKHQNLFARVDEEVDNHPPMTPSMLYGTKRFSWWRTNLSAAGCPGPANRLTLKRSTEARHFRLLTLIWKIDLC